MITNADAGTRGLELPLYGKNFLLACNNSDMSTSLDHWELNGSELQSNQRDAMGIRMDGNGSLIISSPRKHHEGNYTCVFRNGEQGLIVVKGEWRCALLTGSAGGLC